MQRALDGVERASGHGPRGPFGLGREQRPQAVILRAVLDGQLEFDPFDAPESPGDERDRAVHRALRARLAAGSGGLGKAKHRARLHRDGHRPLHEETLLTRAAAEDADVAAGLAVVVFVADVAHVLETRKATQEDSLLVRVQSQVVAERRPRG